MSYAQQTKVNPSPAEQEIISLSRAKWLWMADRKVDSLSTLFHDKSMFVHMGGSWGNEREINVIKGGGGCSDQPRAKKVYRQVFKVQAMMQVILSSRT